MTQNVTYFDTYQVTMSYIDFYVTICNILLQLHYIIKESLSSNTYQVTLSRRKLLSNQLLPRNTLLKHFPEGEKDKRHSRDIPYAFSRKKNSLETFQNIFVSYNIKGQDRSVIFLLKP